MAERALLWAAWTSLVVLIVLLWGTACAGAFILGTGLGAVLARNSRPARNRRDREVTISQD